MNLLMRFPFKEFQVLMSRWELRCQWKCKHHRSCNEEARLNTSKSAKLHQAQLHASSVLHLQQPMLINLHPLHSPLHLQIVWFLISPSHQVSSSSRLQQIFNRRIWLHSRESSFAQFIPQGQSCGLWLACIASDSQGWRWIECKRFDWILSGVVLGCQATHRGYINTQTRSVQDSIIIYLHIMAWLTKEGQKKVRSRVLTHPSVSRDNVWAHIDTRAMVTP